MSFLAGAGWTSYPWPHAAVENKVKRFAYVRVLFVSFCFKNSSNFFLTLVEFPFNFYIWNWFKLEIKNKIAFFQQYFCIIFIKNWMAAIGHHTRDSPMRCNQSFVERYWAVTDSLQLNSYLNGLSLDMSMVSFKQDFACSRTHFTNLWLLLLLRGELI